MARASTLSRLKRKLPARVRRFFRRKGLVRRLILTALALVFVAPVALTLVFRIMPVPATPLMVVRLVEGYGWSRDWVAIEDAGEWAPLAVVAGEDNRFCEHSGIDWIEMEKAYEDWQAGRRTRGASTISMQVAKNLYLWNSPSFVRKGLEAYLTFWIETLWPKRRIMEVYLNVAEWGPGIWGIEAAAQHHFGKPAADLSRREASLLAAVLPSPLRWSPSRPGNHVASRASTISRRIDQLGQLLDCVRP